MDPLIDTAVGNDTFSEVIPRQISWKTLCKNLSSPKAGEKDGSMFVLAKLPQGPCKDECVEHVSAVVFDVDNKKITPLTVQQIEDKLLQLNLKSIIYTTHSHTPQAPRFRLIFPIDKPIKPKQYRSICVNLAKELDIYDYIDTSCFHVARRYFMPRCPEERINDYLFIEVEGEPLKTDDFLSISTNSTEVNFPNADVKQLTPLGLSFFKADADNISQLEHQLSFIDADCDYDQWRNIVWSILSTGWECAEDICRMWSKSAPHRFDEQAFINVVESFDYTRGITLGTLMHYATEAGYAPKTDIFKHEHNRFNFLTPSELQSLPPLPWCIKGLLPGRGLGAIYGPSGSGKSFFVLDLLAKLTTGKKFFGYKVKPCPVVYVALEGQGGIKKRIQAWQKHHKHQLPKTFRVIFDEFSLLNSDASKLAEAINVKGLHGGVIVIDTLNQAAPEADENKSQDMGVILANAQQLQRLTDSLVILIHHTGKDASRGLRGHSSLLAAIDVAIELKGVEGVREWRISKSKDSEGAHKHNFELLQIPLGVDKDGDKINSCVVHIPLFIKPPQPTGKNQLAVLKALESSVSEGGKFSISEAEKISAGALTHIDEKHRKARVMDTLVGLVKNGNLKKTDERYLLV